MQNMSSERTSMIKSQLGPCEITNERLLSALKEIPREIFVPGAYQDRAYQDSDIYFENGRFMLSPLSFAKLIQGAKIKPHDRILDVGYTTGYSTTVLSFLTQTVVGVESDEAMAGIALENLSAMGSANAKVSTAPLNEGYAEDGPYDIIFVHGSVEEVSERLLCQLSEEGGRLVTVKDAKLFVIYRFGNTYSQDILGNASAPSLEAFKAQKSFTF